MKNFSNHACDDGLRNVTDAFADAHREALATSFARYDNCLPAATVYAIFAERGIPLDPTWDHPAFEETICAVIAKALRDAIPRDEEYTAGLESVGKELDEYVESAYSDGEESGHQDGYESGHESGYESGYEEGKADAESTVTLPSCPTCVRPSIEAADPGTCQCTHCGDTFALIDARTLALLRLAAREPVSRSEYERRCGLESAPLSASEER